MCSSTVPILSSCLSFASEHPWHPELSPKRLDTFLTISNFFIASFNLIETKQLSLAASFKSYRKKSAFQNICQRNIKAKSQSYLETKLNYLNVLFFFLNILSRTVAYSMAYTSNSANLIFNFHMPELHLFWCNKVTCITASLKHVFCLLLCFHSLEDRVQDQMLPQ